MAAPPMTSVGWWARRWTRLTATAAAKPTLAVVCASVSARTNAVQKAASVWPLGKLLVDGRAHGGGQVVVGPLALDRRLHDRLTTSDETPAAPSAHDGPPAVGPTCGAP